MPHGIYRIINTDKNDLFALCGGFRVLYICLYSHGFFYFHIDDLNVLYSTEFLNTYMFIPWIFIYVYVYSSPIFTYVYTHISHPFFTYIFVYFITHMCVFFKPLHIDRSCVRNRQQDRLQPSNSRSV